MDAKRLLPGLLAVAVFAAACSGTESTATTTTTEQGATTTTMPIPEGSVTFAPDAAEARLEIDRTDAPEASASDLAALVAADTAFAFDLFGQVAGQDNLMISPYSIASALTMTYAGAEGETRREMAEVLGIGELENVHAARNLLDVTLEASAEAPPREDARPPFNLAVANSLWGQRDYPFVEDFLETLALHYGAGMRLVDYTADPESARQDINTWVEDQTNERIVDLIPPGAVDQMTRLTLVNAIWFKANWIDQFEDDATRNAPFNLLDGTAISAPTMKGEVKGSYARGSGFEAVRLPYVGDSSMLLIVPDEGAFAEVAGTITPELLAEVQAGLTPTTMMLDLPKFEFRSALNLNDTLSALGMPTAFQPPSGDTGADFTGISPLRELSISGVLHQAFITLDEEGTEAAAATAVTVGTTSAGPPPLPVTVDRPFVFVIVHDSTGEILFIGQVTDPTA